MTQLSFIQPPLDTVLPYPWLEPYARALESQRHHWSHAWLINGSEGIGKYALARWMSAVLLCEATTDSAKPCKQCVSCTWLKEDRHPDYYGCVPESAMEAPFHFLTHAESDWIKLDAIRALQAGLYLPPHRQRAKVVLVYPAELLNTAASNALLKLLEEPPPLTTFLLVAHQPEHLLPTLRSRCYALTMSRPSNKEVQTWCVDQHVSPEALAQSGYCPLKALGSKELELNYRPMIQQLLHPDQLDVDSWKQWIDKQPKGERKMALSLMQDIFYKVIHDWLSVHHGWGPRYFPSKITYLNQQIIKISIPKLLNLVHDLNTVREHSKHPLNPTWVLEELVLRYCELWS